MRKREVSGLDSRACLVVVPMWFLPNSVPYSLCHATDKGRCYARPYVESVYNFIGVYINIPQTV